MKFIVATVLCCVAIQTSLSMPVAENAPKSDSVPAPAEPNPGSLLVVPLEKDVRAASKVAEAEQKPLASGDAHEGHAEETAARSLESEASAAAKAEAKSALEIAATKAEEKIPESTEAAQGSLEKTSIAEVSAAPAVAEAEVLSELFFKYF